MSATVGLTVTHRRYVPYAHAHYGGSLVDGAYTLGLFGDVATEVAIVGDGDEGLLAGRSPITIAAACIYFATALLGQSVSAKSISNAAGVSDVTIKSSYKGLVDSKSRILTVS